MDLSLPLKHFNSSTFLVTVLSLFLLVGGVKESWFFLFLPSLGNLVGVAVVFAFANAIRNSINLVPTCPG